MVAVRKHPPATTEACAILKEECLSELILFGERSLQEAVTEFVAPYHSERNHQCKENALLFPATVTKAPRHSIRCRDRLGGLLRY